MLRQSDNSEAATRVRPLQPADVTFLTDLWVAAWQETMPDIDFEARRAWISAFLGDPDKTTLVADATGGLTGFITWEGDYLHQLVVAPATRGDGTAVRLLDAAKSRAACGLMLDVNQANPRAVRFYQREGFLIDGAGANETSGLSTWRMRWPAP